MKTRLRAGLSVACGAVGVVALVSGVVYVFSARLLFNADMFAARVADGLAQPALARIVADQVTDQIIEEHRDLIPYRPLIVGSVGWVVSSPAFRAVVRRAVRESHSRIISESGQQLSLTLADGGVLLRSALAMHPQLAEKVPSRALSILETQNRWLTGKGLGAVLHTGRRLRLGAAVLLLAGCVSCGLGFSLSRRRDRYLLQCGLGLAVLAFLIGAVARFGGHAVAALVHSDQGAEFARGLWVVFVGPLTTRMLVLVGMGLVVVSAATSLLERISVETILHETWRRVGSRPRSPRHTVLLGAACLTVGGLAASHPTGTIELLVVLSGTMLFFVGMQELFAIVMRMAPRLEAAGEEISSRWPSRLVRVAVVAALPLAMLGAGAVWLLWDAERTEAPAFVNACNGHAELCDRPLDKVVFATSHNSMAAADVPGWMFPNHERGIRQQLADGVRGFLVDIHYGVPFGDRVKTLVENEASAMQKYEAALGKEGVDAAMRVRDRLVGEEPTGERDVYLAHGFCELGSLRFVETLEQVAGFLVESPGEVIIMIIQDEGVAASDVAACFERSGLARFLYRGPVTPPWPALRRMIARDQRVVVFAENDPGEVPWYHPAFQVFQETPYRFKGPEEFTNEPGRGGTSGSLLLMNHWIETVPAPKPSNAEIANAFDRLAGRARACRRERGMVPNLIAVDFYATGDLLRVVDALNGVGTTSTTK
jgi:hypothetical protein